MQNHNTEEICKYTHESVKSGKNHMLIHTLLSPSLLPSPPHSL